MEARWRTERAERHEGRGPSSENGRTDESAGLTVNSTIYLIDEIESHRPACCQRAVVQGDVAWTEVIEMLPADANLNAVCVCILVSHVGVDAQNAQGINA